MLMLGSTESWSVLLLSNLKAVKNLLITSIQFTFKSNYVGSDDALLFFKIKAEKGLQFTDCNFNMSDRW